MSEQGWERSVDPDTIDIGRLESVNRNRGNLAAARMSAYGENQVFVDAAKATREKQRMAEVVKSAQSVPESLRQSRMLELIAYSRRADGHSELDALRELRDLLEESNQLKSE